MPRYAAYGLTVDSELPLPDLAEGAAAGDCIRIRRRPVPEPVDRPPVGEGQGWFRGSLTDSLSGYPGVARYRVRDGASIEVDPDPEAEEGLVRHVLLGPVFATLLWQRGLLTLHACVLTVHGRGVAFLAPSGEGKSTLATALAARGHALSSDDVAVIPWDRSPVEALPGFPRMKVYPAVLEQVGEAPHDKPLIHTGLDKRAHRAAHYRADPVRLERIYLLQRGPEERIEALPAHLALLGLMAQSYRPQQLIAHLGRAQLMRMCAKVTERVPVFKLVRPRQLQRLPELAAFVEQHVDSPLS